MGSALVAAAHCSAYHICTNDSVVKFSRTGRQKSKLWGNVWLKPMAVLGLINGHTLLGPAFLDVTNNCH